MNSEISWFGINVGSPETENVDGNIDYSSLHDFGNASRRIGGEAFPHMVAILIF